jgi:hypothetical protein
MKTSLRFTQSEVRHVTCLLAHNEFPPAFVDGSTKNQWKHDSESLRRKFHSIDQRFPKTSKAKGAAA